VHVTCTGYPTFGRGPLSPASLLHAFSASTNILVPYLVHACIRLTKTVVHNRPARWIPYLVSRISLPLPFFLCYPAAAAGDHALPNHGSPTGLPLALMRFCPACPVLSCSPAHRIPQPAVPVLPHLTRARMELGYFPTSFYGGYGPVLWFMLLLLVWPLSLISLFRGWRWVVLPSRFPSLGVHVFLPRIVQRTYTVHPKPNPDPNTVPVPVLVPASKSS
jgi:hypothetical protein